MTAGRAIWGLILILIGGAFLAANLGVLDWGFVISLWRLWPLVLVLLGLRVIFRGRNQWAAAALMLAVVAGGVAIAVADWKADGWASGSRVVQIEGPAAAGFTSAQATIDIGAARVDIRGGDSGTLVRGTYESRREPVISQLPAQGTYRLKIAQRGSSLSLFPVFNPTREKLDLTLAPGIPWTIDVDTGATDATLDLGRVTLERLTIDAGASSIDVTVGSEVVDRAQVVIKGGAGSFKLRVPRTLDLTVRTDSAISSVNIDPALQRGQNDVYTFDGGGNSLTVELSAGVSSISVDLY